MRIITKSLILLVAVTNSTWAFSPEFPRTSSTRIPLLAKPKGSTANKKSNDDLPANLKRPVQAKRPLLGHVVPKDSRFKGCTFQKRSTSTMTYGENFTGFLMFFNCYSFLLWLLLSFSCVHLMKYQSIHNKTLRSVCVAA